MSYDLVRGARGQIRRAIEHGRRRMTQETFERTHAQQLAVYCPLRKGVPPRKPNLTSMRCKGGPANPLAPKRSSAGAAEPQTD